MYKLQKTTVQTCLDADDLMFIQNIGTKYGAKNVSEALRYVIQRHKNLELQLKEVKEQTANIQPTYQEVRDVQMQESNAREKPKWDFLKKYERKEVD